MECRLHLLDTLFARLAMPAIVFSATREFPVLYMNAHAGLAFPAAQFPGGGAGFGKLSELLCFSGNGDWERFCRAVEASREIDDFEARLVSFGGESRVFTLSGNRIPLDGLDNAFVLYLMENGARGYACARDYRRHLQILELLFDNSEDLIYVNRLSDFSLVYVSRALTEALGVSREKLLGQPCWKVLQKSQGGPCSFCPISKINIHPGDDRSDVYVWETTNTHTQKTYIAKDTIIKWVDGQYVHVETATDISNRTEYENQLRRFATTDSMTNISNRMWGTIVLEKRFAEGNGGVSLCFIDIDGLKKTNDTHGHAAGDDLLVETIRLIQQYLAPNDFICRWGGDEFLLMLEQPPESAEKLILQIQAGMGERNKAGGKPYELSFSYGIVYA